MSSRPLTAALALLVVTAGCGRSFSETKITPAEGKKGLANKGASPPHTAQLYKAAEDRALKHFDAIGREWGRESTAAPRWSSPDAKRYDRVVAIDLGLAEAGDADLAHLKGLTALAGLCLSDTKITDAGLVHLKGLKRLVELDLSETQVTDAGLSHLKSLTGLRSLALSNTKITDAGLVHLKGLTELRELFISDTHVTDAGVAELKAAVPRLRVYR